MTEKVLEDRLAVRVLLCLDGVSDDLHAVTEGF
jgi:hypothetical protein